jgi:hypothetical protein
MKSFRNQYLRARVIKLHAGKERGVCLAIKTKHLKVQMEL